MENEKSISIDKILKSANVAELLTAEQLITIGNKVYDEWVIDQRSRDPWETKMKNALDLALQVSEPKSFPWPNASNIKFPLITVAALQYHARAYPALVMGSAPVKCKIWNDRTPEREAQGARISKHMSYQLLEEDEAWEEHQDRTLITQCIIGCAFKKTYYDPSTGHNTSEYVPVKDIYIPYFAPSLEKASRITQVIYLSSNDVRERIVRKTYIDWESWTKPSFEGLGTLEAAKQESQSIIVATNDPAMPYEFLEQHRWLDLDDDGYEEPYIVTVRKDTKQVMRIVARFNPDGIKKIKGQIYKIEAEHYFTKYPFIPSPDGGIYDLGFGVLLGPLNDSINTAVNQLIDAGTLSNTAGGFLGRGAKFRKGDQSFKPFEWKPVDSTGDDLRKSIYPLPVREPSNVLLQLLKLLIDYGERIAMATDPQVGKNPGQNTPAETSRNMITEGQRVFNGIFKRTYRAFKNELQKLYRLNQIFLEDDVYFESLSGDEGIIHRKDYTLDPHLIRPAADPTMVSDSQKLMQAEILSQRAMAVPGYDRYEVEKMLLEAIHVEQVDKIFPNPKGPRAIPVQPHFKVQVETLKAKVKETEMQLHAKLAMAKLMQEADLNQAKINNLQAQAVKALADAQGVETGHEIAIIEAQIGAAKAHQDGLLKAAEIMQKGMAQQTGDISEGNDNFGGLPPMEDPSSHPKPLQSPQGFGG